MRYVKQTLEYLFIYGKGKRFLFLFLLCLFPSAMLVYGLPLEKFLVNFVTPPTYNGWGELWLSYFSAGWTSAVSILLGAITCLLASACIVGAAIKHFRIGVFTLKQLGTSFNDYFLPSVWHTLFHGILYLLNYTIFTAFAYVYYMFLPPTAYTVLCFVTGLILVAGSVYIISSISLWYPGMCIKGDYSPSFFFNAFYRSRAKQKLFLPGHIMCFLILVITAVVTYFVRGAWYVSWIVGSVGVSAALALSGVYMTIVYFGENCLPREDLQRRYL